MAIRYRQLQSPADLSTNIPDNGAASAYESLARTFKDFSNTAVDIGAQVNAKKGEEAGAAAGSSGIPKKQSDFTAYGRAYNNAAEATYVAKTHIDAANTLDQIEQDTAGDLPSYQARAKAYLDTLKKQTPPEFWPKIGPLVEGRAVAGGIKVHGQELHQQGEEAYDTYLKGVPASLGMIMKSYSVSQDAGDQAMAVGIAQNDAHLKALMSGPHPVISAEEAGARRSQFTLQLSHALEQERVANLVDPAMLSAQANVEQGDARIAEVLSDATIPVDVRLAAGESYRKQRELQDYARQHAFVEANGALAQDVAAGGYGPALEDRARTLYKQSGISEGEFRTQLAEMTRNEQKHAADRGAMAAVEDALAHDYTLDPKNAEQAKAVDLKFQDVMAQTGERPGSERWLNAASIFIKHVGILPASAESWVRAGLVSGNAAQAALSASAYVRFRDANPTAEVFNNDPKIKAVAELIDDNLKANPLAGPETAYTLAMNTVNMPEPQKAALHSNYAKGNFTLNNADWLRSHVLNKSGDINPGIFNNTPATPVALQGEFEQQVRGYYDMTGGDIEKARKLAGDAVVRNGLWGRTDVNGAPEVIRYGGVLAKYPTEMLRADIAEKVKRIAVPSAEGHGTSALIDPATVKLVPSTLTERTKGQHWGLQTVDAYGSPTPVLSPDNRPLDYTLPTSNEAFARKKKEATDVEIARSKAARLQYLSIHPAEITQAEMRRRPGGGL